jgi:hypothetical protein
MENQAEKNAAGRMDRIYDRRQVKDGGRGNRCRIGRFFGGAGALWVFSDVLFQAILWI